MRKQYGRSVQLAAGASEVFVDVNSDCDEPSNWSVYAGCSLPSRGEDGSIFTNAILGRGYVEVGAGGSTSTKALFDLRAGTIISVPGSSIKVILANLGGSKVPSKFYAFAARGSGGGKQYGATLTLGGSIQAGVRIWAPSGTDPDFNYLQGNSFVIPPFAHSVEFVDYPGPLAALGPAPAPLPVDFTFLDRTGVVAVGVGSPGIDGQGPRCTIPGDAQSLLVTLRGPVAADITEGRVIYHLYL